MNEPAKIKMPPPRTLVENAMHLVIPPEIYPRLQKIPDYPLNTREDVAEISDQDPSPTLNSTILSIR